MEKIIRYCVLEEDHYGNNVFKIHRPSIFGNPYTHIKNKKTKALVTVDSREEAVKNVLVNTFGVSADRIATEGVGVTEQLYDTNNWNRVVVFSVNK